MTILGVQFESLNEWLLVLPVRPILVRMASRDQAHLLKSFSFIQFNNL